jgi:uncharacterized protein YecT (DUF1311 family)
MVRVGELGRGRRNRVSVVAVATSVLLASVLLAAPPPAAADPLGECQVTTPTQVAATDCLRADLAAADEVIAAALERLQARADELDRVTGRPEARAAVDASQTQWQAFREADCRVRAALAAGASGSGRFALACAVTLARVRAAELTALTSERWRRAP